MEKQNLDKVVEEFSLSDDLIDHLSYTERAEDHLLKFYEDIGKGEVPYDPEVVEYIIKSCEKSVPEIKEKIDKDYDRKRWGDKDDWEKLHLILREWGMIDKSNIGQMVFEFVEDIINEGIGFAREFSKEVDMIDEKSLYEKRRDLIKQYAKNLNLPGYLLVIGEPGGEFSPVDTSSLDKIMEHFSESKAWFGSPHIMFNPDNNDYITIDRQNGEVRTDIKSIKDKIHLTEEDRKTSLDIGDKLGIDVHTWYGSDEKGISLPEFHKLQKLYDNLPQDIRDKTNITDVTTILIEGYKPRVE
jgi:hypothetical protein